MHHRVGNDKCQSSLILWNIMSLVLAIPPKPSCGPRLNLQESPKLMSRSKRKRVFYLTWSNTQTSELLSTYQTVWLFQLLPWRHLVLSTPVDSVFADTSHYPPTVEFGAVLEVVQLTFSRCCGSNKQSAFNNVMGHFILSGRWILVICLQPSKPTEAHTYYKKHCNFLNILLNYSKYLTLACSNLLRIYKSLVF